MFIFDLRLLLFALLLVLLAAIAATVWLTLAWQRRQIETAREQADVQQVRHALAAHDAEQRTRFLLNDLAHELRTPLATLLTHLEVVRLPNISPDQRQLSIQLMQVEGKRMARLLHDMLELGRLETAADIAYRPLDLHALIDDVVAELLPQADARQITLQVQAEPALPLVAGDADRLKQVFLNLIDNAIKYSRAGDHVIVAAQRLDERTAVACAVCDSGPGIPPEHLPHIGRKFYRVAPEASEGSGLGLALASEVLRRHHSELQIESRSDGDETGTCVRFVLPCVESGV